MQEEEIISALYYILDIPPPEGVVASPTKARAGWDKIGKWLASGNANANYLSNLLTEDLLNALKPLVGRYVRKKLTGELFDKMDEGMESTLELLFTDCHAENKPGFPRASEALKAELKGLGATAFKWMPPGEKEKKVETVDSDGSDAASLPQTSLFAGMVREQYLAAGEMGEEQPPSVKEKIEAAPVIPELKPAEKKTKPAKKINAPAVMPDGTLKITPVELAVSGMDEARQQSSLDRHDDKYSQYIRFPGGSMLFGARARGKRNKSMDISPNDWFELGLSGSWKVLCAGCGNSDLPFSRAGAKAACRAAVSLLSGRLREHRIAPRDVWDASVFARNTRNGFFNGTDLEFAQQALHDAVQAARLAIVDAVAERQDISEYADILGHNLTETDLACSFLLALESEVSVGDEKRSFLLSLQLGPGMIALLTPKGAIHMDAGTDNSRSSMLFASSEPFQRERLWRRTVPFFGQLKGLLVMTGGLAMEFNPPEQGLIRLFRELNDQKILPPVHNNNPGERLQNWLDNSKNLIGESDKLLAILSRG